MEDTCQDPCPFARAWIFYAIAYPLLSYLLCLGIKYRTLSIFKEDVEKQEAERQGALAAAAGLRELISGPVYSSEVMTPADSAIREYIAGMEKYAAMLEGKLVMGKLVKTTQEEEKPYASK